MIGSRCAGLFSLDLRSSTRMEFERRQSRALQLNGKAPLGPSERGRAQRFEVKVVRPTHAPPKKSRHNEAKPGLLGCNQKHAH